MILNRIKSWWSNRRSAAAPVELSFSRLQAYLRCPWMYHLIYDLGWRSGPSAPVALGLTMHRTMAAFLAPDNKDRSWENLCQIYDALWVNDGFSGTSEIFDVYDRGQKMLRQFYDADQKRTSDVVGTEKEFEVMLGSDLRFRGTIDRLDKTSDGGYEIVEYKTQGDHWSGTRMENDLQMTLYAMGMKETLKGAPVRLKYHFFSTGETVEAQRTAEQMKAAVGLLKDTAHRIRQQKFEANTTYCAKCEFGKRCEKFVKA